MIDPTTLKELFATQNKWPCYMILKEDGEGEGGKRRTHLRKPHLSNIT